MKRRAPEWRGMAVLALLGLIGSREAAAAGGFDAFAASSSHGSVLSSQVSGPDVSRSSAGSSDQSSKHSSDNSSKSSDDSSAESSGSSDSSRDDSRPRRPRKLIVPQQVRDEAALQLGSPAGLPPSALLRSTLQAFRLQLAYENRGRPVEISDRQALALLLQRAEGAPANEARSVHAQPVGGTQTSRAESRVQRRKQADDQGHATDERDLRPGHVRR